MSSLWTILRWGEVLSPLSHCFWHNPYFLAYNTLLWTNFYCEKGVLYSEQKTKRIFRNVQIYTIFSRKYLWRENLEQLHIKVSKFSLLNHLFQWNTFKGGTFQSSGTFNNFDVASTLKKLETSGGLLFWMKLFWRKVSEKNDGVLHSANDYNRRNKVNPELRIRGIPTVAIGGPPMAMKISKTA